MRPRLEETINDLDDWQTFICCRGLVVLLDLAMTRDPRSGRPQDLTVTDFNQWVRMGSRPVRALAAALCDGESALTDKGCVECHGTPGAGGAMAPDLATVGRDVSPIDFVARMWNKTPAMLAALQARNLEFPALEAPVFADIVAYLYSVDYFSDGGSAQRGRAVLDRKGCTSCHDPAALAAEPGLDHPASITAALWNHLDRLEGSEDFASEWPEFSGLEMADLMAFFQENSPYSGTGKV